MPNPPGRPKDKKDSEPRKMSANSLANIPAHIPGNLSISVRVHGPEKTIARFARMDPLERGQLVHNAIISQDE